MSDDWKTKGLEKDLESMGMRLGVVLDDLNKKTILLEKIKENINYAVTQKDLDYGMIENEAIHFRMRKVFSILYEVLEDISESTRIVNNE